MRITVRVHPRSSATRVVEKAPGAWEVWVTAPPAENRANNAVRDALAGHFNVAKSRIRLVHGAKGRTKIFEWE